MRYGFIERHRTTWPIVIQCAVLAVSRSGYYEWRKRPPSVTATRRAALTQAVRDVHRQSRETPRRAGTTLLPRASSRR